MTVEKCKLRLSRASKLCETLISKEFLVMVSLINEESGLRVSDIHKILGGNKSWISNLCSKLAIAGLAVSKREGREVYYNLNEQGRNVAINAYTLIESLIETESLDFLLEDNTYLLAQSDVSGEKPFFELVTRGLPLHTHKGAILFNKTESYFFFIGSDRTGRLLIIDCPLNELQKIDHRFDDYYKRRYSPWVKPLIIEYNSSIEGEVNLQKIYLFIKFSKIGRSTKNSKWFDVLNEELNQIKEIREKTPSIESNSTV